MRNPCKKCIVKGNCTAECKTYINFRTFYTIFLISISIIIVSIGLFLLVYLFLFKTIITIWFFCICLFYIIPILSDSIIDNEGDNIIVFFLSPIFIVIYILAIFFIKFIMKPQDYEEFKRKGKLKKYIIS